MKKILSIFLSLLLLIGSTGLTLGTHYCGNYPLKSQWVLGEVHLDCGMKMEMKCPRGMSDATVIPKACCENIYLSIPQDNKTLAKEIKLSPAFTFVATVTYAFLLPDVTGNQPETLSYQHSPPAAVFDRQILYQTFLI